MNLAAKIARIGKEIGTVKKTGKNSQQNYSYIEYAEVAGRIRELFDEYGVIIVPNVDEYSVDTITNSKGGKGYHYNLKMSFTIINADKPEDKIMATWFSESADFGDKGINKAETSGTKYFLMRLLNISEKGEKESDADTPNISATKRLDKPAPKEPAKPAVSPRGISIAIDRLRICSNIDDLKAVWADLDELVRQNPEVRGCKDSMKAKLAEVQNGVEE